MQQGRACAQSEDVLTEEKPKGFALGAQLVLAEIAETGPVAALEAESKNSADAAKLKQSTGDAAAQAAQPRSYQQLIGQAKQGSGWRKCWKCRIKV
jgi:hypothetical protein